jgi:TonB-linked SusC/RagA family outer membrane protein
MKCKKKCWLRRLFLMITAICLVTEAWSQQKISGTVVNENGSPLQGVSILLKGTSIGTSTNVDGQFNLSAPSKGILVFSFLGTKNVSEPINNRSTINITLLPDASTMGEVVVVGYGTEKRVNVIGSVSQISGKELVNRPTSSMSNAITGQMPGVTVIQRSGKPGDNGGTIRVRGVGSFGATPDALILVDGIPGTMNEINMNDVESVSVLKDASSAAIYGARSANGVILITTKKGKSGKININYNGYYGISTPTEFPDLVNSWEYAEMFNIANGTASFSAADIAKYKAQNDPDNYPNTNFLKKTFSRNGIQTGHNITLSGGQEKNRYFLSAGYLNEKGLVINNDYTRYNLRLNLENQLAKNLLLTTRISGSIEQRNEPTTTANKNVSGVESIIQTSVRYPAIYLGQASNGNFGIGPESGGTPVSWLASKGYYKQPANKQAVNSRLDWTPVKELTISAIAGYNFNLSEARHYRASQVLDNTVTLPLATLYQSRDKEIYKTFQFTAEYSKQTGKHNLKLLGGYSFEDQRNELFSGNRQNFPSNDYTVMSMGGISNQEVYGDDLEWAIQSLFGRLKYQYNGKYLFEATVRRDGSSRFPTSKKYGTFPSLALGWILTKEKLIQDALPWVYNLKVKASWGVLGNQNIGNYPYQATLANGINYPIGSGLSNGAAYTTYRDPLIHWESTETKDFGIESEFFHGDLSFNATYFNRYTYDVLYKPTSSVSSVLGVGISETNTGGVINKGWEFELGYRNHIGDLNFQVRSNMSVINNSVETLGIGNVKQPNGLVGNGSNLFIGYPLQMYYGYKTDGVFMSNDEVAKWANQTKVNPKPVAGDIRYVDISGPNGVPDGVVDPTYDRTYIGSSIPKYTYAFNLSVNYKAFDFSAFLQGVAGVKGVVDSYAGYAFFNLGTIQKWQMDGRFNPGNPVRYPAYPRLEVVTNSGTPNTVLSDFWTVNASYLRIKNLQVGYTLPNGLLKAVKLSRLRLYVSAENLLSHNHYRKGWDPEINTGGSYYPILATFTGGLNLNF